MTGRAGTAKGVPVKVRPVRELSEIHVVYEQEGGSGVGGTGRGWVGGGPWRIYVGPHLPLFLQWFLYIFSK